MLRLVLVLIALLPGSLAYAGDPLFEMEDPRGDDLGAGTLIYPNGIEWENGDLDLTSFSAETVKDGVWFQVRFRNRVRSPEGLTIKSAAEPIRNFVKYDFFNVNVDIYVDTDAKPGSGNVSTLPGRQVEVDSETAWEKAIILTPRPYPAQSLLQKYLEGKTEAEVVAEQGRISQTDSDQIEKDVEQLMANRFFFPTRIRVSGRFINFFVPNEFLGGAPQANWRYAVVVTAADIEQRVELAFLDRDKKTLMMVPVAQASAIHSWGYEYGSDPNQPPVADVLLPTVALQQQQLSDYDSVSGRLATVRGFSANEFKNYKPTTVAVKEAKPVTASVAKPNVDAQKAAKPARAEVATQPKAKPETKPGAEPIKVKTEVTVKTVTPERQVDDLLKSEKPAVKADGDRSIAQRLRELETLKEEGLISDEEYQRLRKRILSDL